MSSTITTPTIFSLHLTSHFTPTRNGSRISASLTHVLRPHKIISIQTPSSSLKLTPKSVDVSKEDTPVSEDKPVSEVQPISEDTNSEDPSSLESENIDKRRLEEKFAVLNTGIYECRSCGYKYDEAAGDPSYPIAPGLPFGQLPEDWRCPTCGAAKSFFESKSVEIAGFAQNQQFGLGGNSLTSGQKAILIYGALFLFFCLFLSGYFLQ